MRSSFMTATIRVALLLWLGSAGCEQRSVEPESVAEPIAESPPPPPEPAWAEQLAAVRSGASQSLVVSGPVTSEQFALLAEGCEGLEVLRIAEPGLTDDDLAVLPSLVSLRHLVLFAPVGDAGLGHITACPSLEIINLPQGKFTDAGLARLRELPLLIQLRFSSPHVSDAGMEHLAGMTNLRRVHLLDVPITDNGLEPLKRMTLLESFYIDGGKCTEAGLGCLLKSRPSLHMHVNQLHLPGDHGHEHAH
jgi:hypothetical protein